MVAKMLSAFVAVHLLSASMVNAAMTMAGVAQGVRAQAAAVQSASLRQLSDIERSQADAAAILSSLLKTLQSESEAENRAADSVGQWCKASSGQKVGMMQTIQRELDESAIAVRQVGSDSKRLLSEQNLVAATSKEKQEQLHDAVSTATAASSEYEVEQKQIAKTIDATRHAVRLVQLQASGNGNSHGTAIQSVESVSNLMQLSSGAMTDAEKSIMSAYTQDPKESRSSSSAAAIRPQELLQTLSDFSTRLQQNRVDAGKEQQDMKSKLWMFTDHLNSSIIESKSQIASINMEVAQRKREKTRLEGKSSDLSALLKVVQRSKDTTTAVCLEQEQQRTIATKYAAAEAEAVRAVLEQTSPDSSDVFLDVPRSVSMSFLQVRQSSAASGVGSVVGDLQSMARSFPEDASWYTDVVSSLGGVERPMAATPVAATVVDAPAANASANPLDDIEQFVSATSTGGVDVPQRAVVTDPVQFKKVKTAYEGLLGHVQEKETVIDKRRKWCLAITRDAKADGAAVGRSLKRMTAKLNLVKVAMLEYEKTSAYDQEQKDLIDTQLKKLGALADESGRGHKRFYDSLGSMAKQLLGLVSELGQEGTTEERRGAEMARSLVAKVENHQNLLSQHLATSEKAKSAVEAADRAVQASLGQSIVHNNRRLLQFKAEMQFLTSLSHSKSNDKLLSHRYRQISDAMCSPERTQELSTEAKALQKQAETLQKSYQSNVAPPS